MPRPRKLNLRRLGRRFREARQSAGLRQCDLGPAGHVSRIEAGQVDVTASTLWRWSERTGQDVCWLLGRMD